MFHVCSVYRIHTTPEAVPTICCGCFQIQLHIDPPRCRCSNCDTALVRSTMSFTFSNARESPVCLYVHTCTMCMHENPPTRRDIKVYVNSRIQRRCCGRGANCTLVCVKGLSMVIWNWNIYQHVVFRVVGFLLNFKSLHGCFQLESRPAILVFSCIISSQCTTLFSTTCWGN